MYQTHVTCYVQTYSSLQLENNIIDYLKKNPGAQKTLQISKGVGLKTAKDVNSTLYGLQKKQLICKEDTDKPMWSLKNSTAPSCLCPDEVRFCFICFYLLLMSSYLGFYCYMLLYDFNNYLFI